jgi:hypothetical protein
VASVTYAIVWQHSGDSVQTLCNLGERSKVLKRILLGAAVPVVALSGGALLGGVANAAPVTYADTSVAASQISVDQVTGITATFGTPATSVVGSAAAQVPTADKVQFGATDSLGTSKPLTWSIAATTSGATITTGGLLSLPPAPVTAPVALTVEVTDGAAKAFATVNVGVGASALSDSVSATPDTVTLPAAANDNTTGTVDFGSAVPAGQTYTLGNAPVGVALKGSVLAATSAVPGAYGSVTVTASDSSATAVETFTIDVKGSAVKTPPPARPHLYGGHVVYVDNNRAEIAWNESAGVHCVLTRTFGYGFSLNGSPHIGFTCDTGHPGTDAGYWAGLAAGHGYDIQLIPAGANRLPLPGAVTGWIYIHTTQ